MSIPRILVIDDQFATDRELRTDLLDDTNCVEVDFDATDEELEDLVEKKPLAAMTFCRGQKVTNNIVENSYAAIKADVGRGWNEDRKWAPVLLDVMFVSGILEHGNRNPRGREGDLEFGERIREDLACDFPDLSVVMLTGKHQSDLENQDHPFLSKKPISPHELAIALVCYGKLNDNLLRKILRVPDNVVFSATAMKDLFVKTFRCAATNSNVLIRGESGVGKEEVAKYIHSISNRAGGPFVATNVAALPDNLVESELFGHEKGGFTGADARRIGLFERASTGTLFLDEIGDMALAVQAKILCALENREIQRVGSSDAPIPVDIRLISATHRNLSEKVDQDEFRGDLWYRIKTLEIVIPPLRERPGDIIPIAECAMDQFQTQNGKSGIVISSDAKESLLQYDFPGNVRELRNIIESLVSNKGSNTVVQPNDIEVALQAESFRHERSDDRVEAVTVRGEELKPAHPDGTLTLENIAAAIAAMPIDQNDKHLKGALNRIRKVYPELIRRLIGAALQWTKGTNRMGNTNRAEAIALLEDNANLTGADVQRQLNEALGRNRTAGAISDEEENALIEAWEKGPK